MNEERSTELTTYQQSQNVLAELREKVKTLEVNDATLDFAAETMAVAKRVAKVCDKERKTEKEPHLVECQEIDNKYGLITKPCLEIADKIERMIAAHNRKKAEEAEKARQEHERLLREAEAKRKAEEERIRKEQERIAREAEERKAAEEKRIREEHERKMEEIRKASEQQNADKEAIARQQREAEESKAAEERRLRFDEEQKRIAAENAAAVERMKNQQETSVMPLAPQDGPQEKIQTTFGSVKIKDKWTYEEVEFVEVPREWLMLDEKKILKAINAKENPIRTIPGLAIHPEEA